MKSILKLFTQVIYYFLILFISYTMMNKLLAIESFQVNLLKTGVFSNTMAVYLSYIVIISEFLVLLILVFRKKTGSMLLLIMLAIFTIYISWLRFYGRYEVCGCGGVLNGLAFKYHFMINMTLIFFAILLNYTNLKNIENEN
jgi:hypothetical protein